MTGSSTVKHLFANGVVVATVTNNGTSSVTNYVLTDHLGGTSVVTDDSGNILETMDYYPYGSARLDDKAEGYAGEKRKYIGQEYDEATELSYLNARYYDSARGQFTSQDPVFLGDPKQQNLENPQSLNSYAYAKNNPISNSDPSGQLDFKSIQKQIDNIKVQINNLQAQINAVRSDPKTVAQQAYESNKTFRYFSDHPYLPAVIGVTPLAIYGAGTALYPLIAGPAGTACANYCDDVGQAKSGITETAKEIAGHAVKHFPGESLESVAARVQNTMLNPEVVRLLENSRVGFFNSNTGMNVIFNPNVPYSGTAVNTLADPKGVGYYFFKLLH